MLVLSGGLAKLWPLVSCDSMVPEARWKMTCRVRATRCESGNMNPSSQLKGKKDMNSVYFAEYTHCQKPEYLTVLLTKKYIG